ncbi:MAG: GMC family oxidoreductase, partial [Pseudomonadota bacterium]
MPDTRNTSFDYVVIGSGAAGSVVAARLAEAKMGSVCVVEAGGDNNRLMVKVPAGFVRNLNKPELMWQFGSVAGENTAGRSVYIPQGKLLGGSTSINGMVYNRGQRDDFDHWGALGNPGWSYQDVLPYFRKSERFDGPASQARGANGPLCIGRPEQPNPLCDAFTQSVSALANAPIDNDYNGETQFGTGYYQ